MTKVTELPPNVPCEHRLLFFYALVLVVVALLQLPGAAIHRLQWTLIDVELGKKERRMAGERGLAGSLCRFTRETHGR